MNSINFIHDYSLLFNIFTIESDYYPSPDNTMVDYFINCLC